MPLLQHIEKIQAGSARSDIKLTDWLLTHSTLEDVFIELVKGRG